MNKNAKTEAVVHPFLREVRVGNQPTCLFVGDPLSLRRAGQRLPATVRMDWCHIYDLSALLQAGRHPDLVLSFAITPLFDCLDLAQMLSVNGFRGRQRIIDSDLPAPKMICREVKLACPGIDFAVLERSELLGR